MSETLTGVGTLVRFFLRRDRWMILWWTIGATGLYWTQAVSVDGLYSTQAELRAAAASMESNAGFVAMAGPPRVLDTVGGQVAWQSAAFGAVVAGLMSMFLIVRHTRAEEESGREELVRSGVVGSRATVAAAVTVMVLANVVLGSAIAASLIGYGLAVAGSVSLGLAAALAGVVFGCTALVAAQLTDGARSAYGVTGAVIAFAYVVRAAGDVADNGLSWLSPIGWGQAMRAYADERWWPVVLSLVVAGLLGWSALLLLARRDVGSGLRPARRGPATGSLGHLGLAWRLQRGTLVGWTAGMLLVGASYGSIGNSVGDLLGDSELSEALLAQGADSVTDAFYGTAVLMLAIMTGAYAISSALRPRGEELGGRIEPLLSTPLPRLRWALGHTALTVVGVVVVLSAAGLATGAVLAAVVGDGSQVLRLTAAAVAYAPAVLVLSATTRLAYGLRPRLATVGWLGLAFCAVVMMFGEVWRLPGWLRDASPFEHLAMVPVESVRLVPLVAVTAVAVALSAVGHWLLARRDMVAG